MDRSPFVGGLVFVSVLFLFFLMIIPVGALDITASGEWTDTTINANNLVAGAGSQLTSTYTSSSGIVKLSISGCTGGTDTWKVTVVRSDSSWPFTLSARKGEGSYQVITTTAADFFSGADNTSDIPLQFKLENVSITITPGNYSTTVTYWVVDT